MEKPDAATTAWYDRAVPADPRAVKGKMFGHPCAFVNGNMFFGTFGQSVIARLGEPRAAEVGTPPLSVFEPMPGKAWREYVRIPAGARSDAEVAELAREALEWTHRSIPAKPAKAEKKPAAKKKR